MTIVYIYRSLAVFGGVEKVFIDKANYLAEKCGYNVYIITYEQGKHPIIFPLSPKVKHIDLNILFYKEYECNIVKRLIIHYYMENKFITEIKRLIQSVHADVMIGASCEYSTMKALSKVKGKVVTIIENHSARMSIEKPISQNPLKNIIFQLKNKKIYRYINNVNAFITLSQEEAKSWSTVVTSTSVIPNMLSPEYEGITHQKKETKTVISVGRLVEQKGYDLLLRAWEKVHSTHPDWKLEIYGEGKEKTKLLQLRDKLGLCENVSFLQPTTQIIEKYKSADIYVMSSRFEGFGLVLIEAMACELPCISFNCPNGPSEIIVNNETGYLVENNNINELSDKIIDLIEYPEIRQRMGKKGQKNIQKYQQESIMKKWDTLFKTLIKGHKK